jgi:hypothetical protein
MTAYRVSVPCLAIAVAVALGGAAPGQEVKLRYQFKEGDKLNYVMDQTMTMEMALAGQTVKLETMMGFETTIEVKSVDKDGKAQVTQTITRVQFEMDSPNGKLKYDTADPKDPEVAAFKAIVPVFKSMAGAEVNMTLDARGQAADFKLSDKFKDVLKNNPAASQLGDLATEEGVKKFMGQTGLRLPEEAVKKGSTWTTKNEIKNPQAGTVTTEGKHTYEGQETRDGKALEKISIELNQSVDSTGAPTTIKIKTQDSRGTAWFDNAAGRLVETSLTQDVVQEVSAKNQTITQTLKTKVGMKLQEKK